MSDHVCTCPCVPCFPSCLRARTEPDRARLRASLMAFAATAPIGELRLLDELRARLERGREDYAQAVSINGDKALGVVGRRALLDLYIADTVAGGEE